VWYADQYRCVIGNVVSSMGGSADCGNCAVGEEKAVAGTDFADSMVYNSSGFDYVFGGRNCYADERRGQIRDFVVLRHVADDGAVSVFFVGSIKEKESIFVDRNLRNFACGCLCRKYRL